MKNPVSQENLDSVLWHESRGGHTDAVKALLKAGADVHALGDWALGLASQEGQTETVKVLIEAGADVHACNDYALRAARAGGHTETVKLLEAAAAEADAASKMRESFKQIGIELMQKQAVKVTELFASLAANGGSPGRPTAGAKPLAPPAP